jgi:hypothetical protein
MRASQAATHPRPARTAARLLTPPPRRFPDGAELRAPPEGERVHQVDRLRWHGRHHHHVCGGRGRCGLGPWAERRDCDGHVVAVRRRALDGRWRRAVVEGGDGGGDARARARGVGAGELQGGRDQGDGGDLRGARHVEGGRRDRDAHLRQVRGTPPPRPATRPSWAEPGPAARIAAGTRTCSWT